MDASGRADQAARELAEAVAELGGPEDGEAVIIVRFTQDGTVVADGQATMNLLWHWDWFKRPKLGLPGAAAKPWMSVADGGAGRPALDVGDVQTCPCGVPFFFAVTGNGSNMPVVADSAWDPAGNLAVWREGGKLRCAVLAKTEMDRDTEVLAKLLAGLGRVRYRNHFADCPQAAHHRKGR